MAWDRVDLVEEKLMVRDAMSRASETLNETMKHALQKDRVKFIELMIMNGFVMSKFLTVETLAALYNDAVSRFKELPEQLRRLTGYSGGAIRLRDIHKMLVVTLKEHRMRNYELDHHPGAVVRRQNVKKGEEGRALLDLQRNRFEVRSCRCYCRYCCCCCCCCCCCYCFCYCCCCCCCCCCCYCFCCCCCYCCCFCCFYCYCMHVNFDLPI